MRVLICGGRDYNNRPEMFSFLNNFCWEQEQITDVIHGGARGADTLAGEWALSWHIPVLVFPADWKKHGKAAGPIRNQQMLDEGKPDVVIAFPGGRGTADMIRRAKAAGIEVLEVTRS